MIINEKLTDKALHIFDIHDELLKIPNYNRVMTNIYIGVGYDLILDQIQRLTK